MSFEIGQTVWLLSVEVDEYGSSKFPWVFPKTFDIQEAKIVALEDDDDGFVEIQLDEGGGRITNTHVEPRILLVSKPNIEQLNSF